MRKICILQNGLKYGGTDTFVLNLAKHLDKKKYDITVVLSGNKDDFERLDELDKYGINIEITSDLNCIKGKINHLWKLYKILKREKYDVFQSNIDLFNGPNMFVSWIAGIPVRVCHSHNSEQGRELREGNSISLRLYQRLMKWLCWNFSNRYTGCSELALDFLFDDRWRRSNKAWVIYNGIELSDYKNLIDVNKKKFQLEINENSKIITTIGRISYQKNPVFLAQVFGELCKLRTDCELLWAGKGDLENETKEMLISYGVLDKVHFLGTRSDIPDILKCTDVFFLPSIFEGLGIVLIEAQASGVPCLTSDTIPELANCGGIVSYSLDNSITDWAKMLNGLIDGKISYNIEESKINKYSIEHMVWQMEQAFD